MNKINKTLEILSAIDKAGIISVKKLSSMEHLQGLFTSSKYPRLRIADSVRLMSRQGFISLGHLDNEPIVKITKKGQKKLSYYRLVAEGKQPDKVWGNKWYLVTFDIPESRKVARNKLILILKDCGFVSYSKGIWMTPYDKQAFIKKVAAHLDLTVYVRSIIATDIDKSSLYKKRFGL